MTITHKPPLTSTQAWLAENTALYLTTVALRQIEEGDSTEAYAIYDGLELEHQQAFSDFLDMVNSPALTWREWVNLCRYGMPYLFVPHADLIAQAHWHGFQLGVNGIAAATPSTYSLEQREAFERGLDDGFVYSDAVDELDRASDAFDDRGGLVRVA